MADTINMGEPICMSPGQIALVEERYGARYIGDFAVKQSRGWTDRPVAVFWRRTPHPTYGRYFGMFRDVEAVIDRDKPEVVYGSWKITDAQSVADHRWSGARAADGEIVFSRFNHDFRSSTDGSVSVDGGPLYSRRLWDHRNPPCSNVLLALEDAEFRVVEEGPFPTNL